MKKKIMTLNLVLLTALFFSITSFAQSPSKDIPVGASGQIELIGTIEPTILSVTVPSQVPFDISKSLLTQNKVISPRVNIKNNSNVPVQLSVVQTTVDLSNLSNAIWSNTGEVNENQIAIGLKVEEESNVMPTNLNYAKWLRTNYYQSIDILEVEPFDEGAIYVVGTLGRLVSEDATFKVVPTFVVSQSAAK